MWTSDVCIYNLAYRETKLLGMNSFVKKHISVINEFRKTIPRIPVCKLAFPTQVDFTCAQLRAL